MSEYEIDWKATAKKFSDELYEYKQRVAELETAIQIARNRIMYRTSDDPAGDALLALNHVFRGAAASEVRCACNAFEFCSDACREAFESKHSGTRGRRQ